MLIVALSQKLEKRFTKIELVLVCLKSFNMRFEVIKGLDLVALLLCNKLSASLHNALLFKVPCN